MVAAFSLCLAHRLVAQVLAEVSINLAHFDRMQMREEWDSLREHDVVFLISIQSPHVSRSDLPPSPPPLISHQTAVVVERRLHWCKLQQGIHFIAAHTEDS